MSFQTFEITAGMPEIHLMGRMDKTQKPLALDWTGSGMGGTFVSVHTTTGVISAFDAFFTKSDV